MNLFRLSHLSQVFSFQPNKTPVQKTAAQRWHPAAAMKERLLNLTLCLAPFVIWHGEAVLSVMQSYEMMTATSPFTL